MKFEDICWLDSIFEEMMTKARKAKSKKEVIAIIREHHYIIKEQKLNDAKAHLHGC